MPRRRIGLSAGGAKIEQETPMKAALIASAAIILAGTAAYAQDYGPTYNNSIHQSAGDRDSRGTPKYYHSRRGERGEYRRGREYGRGYGYEGRGRSDDYMQGRSTTGAGSSYDR